MLTAKINNIYSGLTQTEKKIASFILENPEQTVKMTAKQLSEKCGTVPSAVIRLCKSAGLSGFTEMKLLLSAESGTPKRIGDKYAKDDTESAFGKVFSESVNTLENTFNLIDFKNTAEIVDMLNGANRIFLFGIGASAILATDAAYRFSQIGIEAYAYSDLLYMNSIATNLKKGDIAIFISHSGNTKVLFDTLRYVKASGAVTMTITSYSKSIIALNSDYVISAYADEENYPVEAVSARIAHMCIIYSLVAALITRRKNEISEYLSRHNKVIEEIVL